MKLKNITKDVRELRDQGQVIQVGPKEIIEVENPFYERNVFEIVDDQKSKDKKTLDIVKKEKLNKKEKN